MKRPSPAAVKVQTRVLAAVRRCVRTDPERRLVRRTIEMSTWETDEEANEDGGLAEILGFVLRGRPERLEDSILAIASPGFRAGVQRTREALVRLACSGPEAEPSVEVRARLVDTVARRMPRRALLVIDMIHDHLDPGSLLEVPRAREVVPALGARLAAARREGIPVVYVIDEHDADDPDLLVWGVHAVRGTKGAEVWTAIAPAPGDLVVKKTSYSAFFQTALEDLLDRLAIDTLVLTGCLTEIGIMATAADALQRGFVVEVPPDSQAGLSAPSEAATLGTLRVMAPFGPARVSRLSRLAA
jgi:nicotinamidase-related amidase